MQCLWCVCRHLFADLIVDWLASPRDNPPVDGGSSTSGGRGGRGGKGMKGGKGGKGKGKGARARAAPEDD